MGFAGNNELRSCSPAVGTTYELTEAEQAALKLDDAAIEVTQQRSSDNHETLVS